MKAETQDRGQQRQVPEKGMSLASLRNRKATVAGTEEGQQEERGGEVADAFLAGHQMASRQPGFHLNSRKPWGGLREGERCHLIPFFMEVAFRRD